MKAAAKEGTLNVAWGNIYGGGDGVKAIQDAIDKKYHIQLQIVYSNVANGAAFQNQVAQEVRVGQPASSDILFNIRDADLARWAMPVDYRKYVPALPDDVMYFEHRSVTLVSVLNAFEYDTRAIPKDRVPQSLADLLKPEWKGKLASSPYQGEFGAYLGLPEFLGHDAMIKFYTAFSAQLAGLITCGESDRVIGGEFQIFGLDCGDYEVRLKQRKNVPMGAIYPKEGTNLSTFSPGIPLTSQHPNAARLFIAYLLTRQGQDLLWQLMGCDNYKLAGSHVGQLVADLRRRGVKLIETYGMDVQHPELRDYAREINKIINQSH